MSLKKEFTKLEIKPQLEFRFNLRGVLLDFQSFPEKPVFECAFAHPIILFLSCVVKNCMDRVSVICKLAMKWYLMRMCTSWLCPLKMISSLYCTVSEPYVYKHYKWRTRWNANRCYSLRTTYLIFETFQVLFPTASMIFTAVKLFHELK